MIQIPQQLNSSSPARHGALVSTIVGVALFGFGLYLAFVSAMPGVLGVAVMIAGFLDALVGWYTLKRVRVAWAFACSLNGTAFIVFLFGAPKVRDAAEIPIGGALLPAFLFGVLTLLLALGSEEFRQS